jgi:hypothetical protein
MTSCGPLLLLTAAGHAGPAVSAPAARVSRGPGGGDAATHGARRLRQQRRGCAGRRSAGVEGCWHARRLLCSASLGEITVARPAPPCLHARGGRAMSRRCVYRCLLVPARQSPLSVQQLRSQGATIVDVRAEHEFECQEHGHVVGAINWPLDTLSQRLSSGAVDRKAAYVTYCKGTLTSHHRRISRSPSTPASSCITWVFSFRLSVSRSLYLCLYISISLSPSLSLPLSLTLSLFLAAAW